MTGVSKSYFNRKLRVGKLDSALLFLSSTIGLIFAVIRAAVNPTASIVTSIPLFALGILLPFYYGYVRGALVRSSAVDRYRGWIFFLVGLGAYGYDIIIEWANEVLPASLGRLSYLADVPVAVISILAGVFVARRFHNFILKTLGEPSSPLIVRAALNTAMSAIFFAAVGSNVATIQPLNVSTGGPLLLLLVAGIYLLRRSELYANYVNSDVRFSFETVTGKWYGKRVPSWSGFALDTAALALFLFGTLYFVTTATTLRDVVQFLLELVASLVLLGLGSLLTDFVGKREVLRVSRT